MFKDSLRLAHSHLQLAAPSSRKGSIAGGCNKKRPRKETTCGINMVSP